MSQRSTMLSHDWHGARMKSFRKRSPSGFWMAKVNRVQIAEIEAGRKSGSLDTVKKLASALGVTIDDLV